MKTDREVGIMFRERAKGMTQEQAAARAGMSVRTARTYERRGKPPSQRQQPRRYRTRPNPFADDWPWVEQQLARDPALQATTLFALLWQRRPEHYQAAQLRTLQRQIAAWRAQHGPAQEVFFTQIHRPGIVAQSDFTHMTDLGPTLGGVPFPHLLFHLVLVYSNTEAVQLVLAERFEALAEGIEVCLWQIGGVPRQHRTDHLSAAMRPLDGARTQSGNGAVCRPHGPLRDGADDEQPRRRARERRRRASPLPLQAGGRSGVARPWQPGVPGSGGLRPLPPGARTAAQLDPAGALCRGATPLASPAPRAARSVPRGAGAGQPGQHDPGPAQHLLGARPVDRHGGHRPGAGRNAGGLSRHGASAHHPPAPRGAATPHRLPPHQCVVGAQARRLRPVPLPRRPLPDADLPADLRRPGPGGPHRADRDYVRLLHLAAGTSEAAVEAVLAELLGRHQAPAFDLVRDRPRLPTPAAVPELTEAVLDFGVYDELLAGEVSRG